MGLGFFPFHFLLSLFAPDFFSNYAPHHKLKSLGRDIYSPEDQGEKPRRSMMQIARFANLFAISNLRIFGIRVWCAHMGNVMGGSEATSSEHDLPQNPEKMLK
jgi:hypothetical protein